MKEAFIICPSVILSNITIIFEFFFFMAVT